MYTKFKNLIRYALLFILIGVLNTGILLTSCKDNSDDGTSSLIALNSYGPMPVARGAELRFIGTNLDKVTAISLPGGIEILAAAFVTKTATLITITVPQNAVEGLVVVKNPQGDITTKTPIGFSEPISIASFTPNPVKAGQELTITGDYLNLVKEVIFTDRVSVGSATFVSQTRSQLKVIVPAAAQTGKISVSDGKADPIIVFSTASLQVKLPVITTFLPNPVKAGTNLTITGTDLDLVKTVALGGSQNVTSFVSQTGTQLVLKIPNLTQDDTLRIIPASGVKVKTSAKLVLVVPTVTVIPSKVKNGATITVKGTDLDLVTIATFAGSVTGTITNQTATSMDITVPLKAIDGTVVFSTNSGKTVTSAAITYIKPTITTIAPLALTAGDVITISGTDLDLVSKVTFGGGLSADITAASATSFTIAVPAAATSGTITLETTNGSKVVSAAALVVTSANKPVITDITASVKPGGLLTITGTKLHLVESIYFQTNVKAIAYGVRTATKIEVYVPETAKKGSVTITLNAFDGATVISPTFSVAGTDPVLDPSLMIYSFDAGWSGFTWDGVGGLGTLPDGVDGTNHYYEATPWNASKYWLFANNYISYASVSQANHVVKMDVRLRTDVTGNAEIRLMLGGKAVNILSYLQVGDKFTTGGDWKTITLPLSAFSGLADPTPVKGGEWGMTMWGNGLDFSGFCIDNIRYELVP
jgi:hypothetical protein